MSTDTITQPYVGMPATINLYNDRQAAVVVKVNKKSVIIARVAVDESSERVTNPGEPYPCMVWDGITTEIIGEPCRYPMITPGNYRDGSISVTLGRSVSVRDYRY